MPFPTKQSTVPKIQNAAGQPIRMQDTAHFGASRAARELKSWNPITLSPDSELNTELPTLVERSRDIARNHGMAAGAVQTLVDNVVGTGLRLRSMPDYQALGKDRTWSAEWTRHVESKFSHYANSIEFDAGRLMNFYAMTAIL
jgi:capsid protein